MEVAEPRRSRRRSGIMWWRDGQRRCSDCQGYYAPACFAARANGGQTGDGLDIYCLDCRSAANKRYYDGHREQEIADALARRARNRRQYLRYMRLYSCERREAKRLGGERTAQQEVQEADDV